MCKWCGDPRCTPSEMLSPLALEGPVYRERRFRGGQWSPIQLVFALRTHMLGPLISEGAVVLEGAVYALHIECLAPLVSEGAVVSEAFMRTWTKCPCLRAGTGACSVL